MPWWMCNGNISKQYGCRYADACTFNWMCSLNISKQYDEQIKIAQIIQGHYAKAKTWGQLKSELYALCNELDQEQYEEITQFIECHHLVDKLTLRSIVFLALLAKDVKVTKLVEMFIE